MQYHPRSKYIVSKAKGYHPGMVGRAMQDAVCHEVFRALLRYLKEKRKEEEQEAAK